LYEIDDDNLKQKLLLFVIINWFNNEDFLNKPKTTHNDNEDFLEGLDEGLGT
jgi:hypothetical protein